MLDSCPSLAILSLGAGTEISLLLFAGEVLCGAIKWILDPVGELQPGRSIHCRLSIED